MAIGVEPPLSEEPYISCTFALPDRFDVAVPGDRAGHWLIRPNTCPDGGLLYGLSGENGGTGKLIQINTCTGAGTEVASLTPFGGDAGLAFDANRGLFYVLDGQAGGAPTLFSIQIGTWITAAMGTVDLTILGASHVADTGLAYDPGTDTLYLVEQNNNTLFAISVDPNREQPVGSPTEIGPVGLSVENVGLAFDEVSNLLFAVTHSPDQDPTGTGRLIEIDPATGVGVEIGSGIGDQLTGAAIGIDRELGYASDSLNDRLVMVFPTIAPSSSSVIGPIGFGNVEGLAYVPEPSFGLMLLLGVGGLAGLTSRSRHPAPSRLRT